MLKILMIIPQGNQYVEYLRENFNKSNDVYVAECNSSKEYPHKVLETEIFDLIITFDLVGFEQTTLMGGISYNLVNSNL